MKLVCQGFQTLQHEQDRQIQTDATERITTQNRITCTCVSVYFEV